MMKLYSLIFPLVVGVLIVQQSCIPGRKAVATGIVASDSIRQKIHLELNEIDENGLIGPVDGKRSVAYEFCIPFNKKLSREVKRIDPSVRFFHGPGGRVGCDDNEYLCIGEGASASVLLKLASLSYIKKIKPFFGE